MPINRNEPLSDRWYDPTSLMERAREQEVIKCKCGCSFLEQVPVHQFPKTHNVILGQPVQPYGGIGFYVLRCIKCGEVYEPSVQLAARDQARKVYDAFLDQMEQPVPSTKAPKGSKGDPEVL